MVRRQRAAFVRRTGLEALPQRGWRPVFDKIGKLGEKHTRGLPGNGILWFLGITIFPLDENFLKLIEG